MLVIGWHGGWASLRQQSSPLAPQRYGVFGHDASAVILRDGRLVAGIEEERLDRVKHSCLFPRRAIQFCLDAAGARISDVDFIAADTSEEYLDSWVRKQAVLDCNLPVTSGRQWLAQLFNDAFGVDVTDKLRFCKHHLAHMHAAWYSSGFEHALGVCIDAEGDGPSGLIANCKDDQIKLLRSIPASQSLGYFYLKSMGMLGYKLFDEYKVMGLAPYGDPAIYAPALRQMYELLPDGKYLLASDEARDAILVESGLTKFFRRKGEAFTDVHKNIAASIQAALEDICEHVVKHYLQVTGARKLCLTGGVAQNCAMSGKILCSRIFDEVYVPPCAHDGGNAFGAALAVMREAGQPAVTGVLKHAYIGADIGSNEIVGERLQAWGALISAKRIDDPVGAAAKLIADGKVIAWVQGRSEFGPRALGNRSILADPRPAENKRIINSMVKKREAYRPFAPSVLEERVREFFDVPETQQAAPFMALVVPVRESMRELLGAITHVDGTARIQTVSRDHNPLYHGLIESFGRLTGVPIVLNTSFNNHAEPIVDSVDDAVTCFLTTGIHNLIVGDWLVEKIDRSHEVPAFLDLVAAVPESRKLITARSATGELDYACESIVHHYFAEESVPLSPTAHQVLRAGQGEGGIRKRCEHAGICDGEQLSRLASELYDLWERRIISLAPA